jgi:tetratricopeptide (TPR) repeat protein
MNVPAKPSQIESSVGPGWRPFWLPGALIFLLALVAYARSISFEFVFDDQIVVTENYFVHGFGHVRELFSEHIFTELHPTVQKNYFRPVWYLTLATQFVLFGLKPAGWHFVTVLLHAIASVLVWRIGLKLTTDEKTAAAAGALFAVHPAHVEAAAWVSGSAEPTAACFLLASFLCYLRWREFRAQPAGGALRWMIASVGLYVLGALSKEGAIVLPALIFFYEYFRGEPAGEAIGTFRTRIWSAATRAILFAPGAVLCLTLRLNALRSLGTPASSMTTTEWLLTVPSVLTKYLRILLFPFGLSPFYDLETYSRISLTNFFLPLTLVVVFAGAVVWLAREDSAAKFAASWMLLTLLPVLNLRVFPEGEIVHDRYLYLPSVGFCILAAILLERAARAILKSRMEWKLVPLSPAAAGLSVLLTALVFLQLGIWKNNRALYEYGVRAAPRNDLAANNLALELMKAGENERAKNVLTGVLQRNSNYWLAVYNYGLVQYRLGNAAESERALLHGVKLNPTDADQFAQLARAQFRLGKKEDAIACTRRAIALRPRAPAYHLALGLMLREQGRETEAMEAFRKELEIQPTQTAARQFLQELEAKEKGQPAKPGGSRK